MTQSQVHILVVDDERNIRNNLGMVLEAEGYKVDKASNGDDALLQIKAGLYDIVFVDIQMLCEEILQRQKIGMSGTVDELLHLAELARGRKSYTEARVYLKIAIMRDVTRPEPHYQLGELAESEGRTSHAVHYYYMALDAQSTFQPARDALKRLGRLDAADHHPEGINLCLLSPYLMRLSAMVAQS